LTDFDEIWYAEIGRIFPELLLIYCGGHLIFFAQDGDQKRSVAEPDVVQKLHFIPTNKRCIFSNSFR